MKLFNIFRRKRRYLREGDIMPEGHPAPGCGAIISIDPETRRIIKIFMP